MVMRNSTMTMMNDDSTFFGDSEPEDAWHPDDTIVEQLENIRRRIVLLAAAAADSRWDDRAAIRARDTDEDLRFVIARLIADG
jgi:hypothetical protein